MVSGSRAEQPNPASAKASTPATGARDGSTEISSRPAVTMAQNTVRASDATVAEFLSEVRSSCDQFPFMVSQNPYITPNAANSQKAAGIAARRPGAAAGGDA